MASTEKVLHLPPNRECSSGVEHHLAKVRVVGSNPITRSKPSLKEGFLLPRPDGGIGRHVGLKIQWAVMPVRVQVPSRVQAFNPNRLEVFFIDFSFPIFSTENKY